MEKKGKYIAKQDLEPKYINGVYGGPGAHNEIIALFYYERFNNPGTYNIKFEDGANPEVTIDPNEYDYIRHITTSITMNLDTAKKMHQWLGGHINTIESRLKDNE